MTVSTAEVDADPKAFRRAIARWATGVSVVTAHAAGTDYGLTVNSLTSVTLEPPLLLVSLNLAADTTPVVKESKAFGVSVLTSDQREVSEKFATTLQPKAKFEGISVHRGALGVALLDEALATFECRVEREMVVSDHALFVGRVVGAAEGASGNPLIFFRSQYAENDGSGGLRLSSRAGR